MLKNIPKILSPELLKVLMEMGHGDEIVIADGNFPAASLGQRIIRCDGHGVCDLLAAVMQLFPLDAYSEKPVALMEVVPGDTDSEGNPIIPAIWQDYHNIIETYDPENCKIEMMERFEFYERAKKAYAVVATGETAIYANIILKKGVVK